MTMPSSRRCTMRSASDIPRAAAAGGMVRRLGDGVGVLIRTMKKITKITGQTGTSWLRGGERMQHWHRRARVDARRSFLHWQQ